MSSIAQANPGIDMSATAHILPGALPAAAVPARLKPLKVIFFANTAWYLYNFRLGFAKYLRDRGFEVVLLSPACPSYGTRLQAEGFRWIAIPMVRRSLNPARELALLRQISAVYAAERPDIVHHFTLKCVIYGSIVAWLQGIRNRVNAVDGMGYVFTSGQTRARLLKPLVSRLMKWALAGKHSRLVLQNDDDLSAFRKARSVREEHIRLIRGCGLNTERFQPRPRVRHIPVTRVLLAARLLWDKGIGEYVEAARLLKKENIAVQFLLAGTCDSGNPASVTPVQVAQWRWEGIVTHLGHVEDMPALLAEIDVVVLPSYREGVPCSLIEAAASGLPIVTTDAPGCREIVQDGINGVLVPLRDVAALAEAIRFLHERPDERGRMGNAGRQKVLKEFDERIVFEKTFAIYRELLSASSQLRHRTT